MMTNQPTIYVFWEGKNQPERLSIVNHLGVLQTLSIDELRLLTQQGFALFLVLSSKSCSIYPLELPKLSQKELNLAIQSVLEDKLLQNFSQLWWWYAKNDQGLYDVLVWDKAWLADVKAFFERHQLPLRGMTLDWFALKSSEVFVLKTGDAVIRSKDFNGFLTRPLFELLQNDLLLEKYRFYSAQTEHTIPQATEVEVHYQTWIWQRFQEQIPYNIDAPIKKIDLSKWLSPDQVLRYFPKVCWSTLGFVGMVFVGLFLNNIVIYFNNFGQFKNFSTSQVREIQANLSRYQFQQSQKKQFWGIWVALQKCYQPRMIIQQLQFEQNSMQIHLEIQSVMALQQFKNQLNRYRIKVIQSQVQSIPNGVRVILKLQGPQHG